MGKTLVGVDAISGQVLGTSAQPAAFNYVALTANSEAFKNTDTTLAGEIKTAGGGLIRAQGTYAHTTGASTSTITKTFTFNGSDVGVTVAKAGLFNASLVGTMAMEEVLSSTVELKAVEDAITVTLTVTWS